MYTQGTPLAAILTGAFNIALVFTPLFLSFAQLAVGLGVSILLLAVATGIHDTWWVQQRSAQAPGEEVTAQQPPLPKAA